MTKEERKEYSKQYYKVNREKILKQVKLYSQNNPQQRKDWLFNNKERIKGYTLKYKQSKINNINNN